MDATDPEKAYFKENKITYLKMYQDALNLQNINNGETVKYLKNKTTQEDFYHWSHINRIGTNVQVMKYTYVCEKTNMITACFKMSSGPDACVYAYLYFEYVDGKIHPRFVCTGPTFSSQDGEYRDRMIPWAQFEKLMVTYAREYALVEAVVLNRIENGDLSFRVDFYYTIDHKSDRSADELIKSGRIPVKCYIMCWLHDYYRFHVGIAENHINQSYKNIVFRQDELHVLESILAHRSPLSVMYMTNKISSFYSDPSKPGLPLMVAPHVGQKIFPLSAIEAVKTHDINFNVWRELYINNLASNLVLNLISPSFPFINNWFYVQNSNVDIFDNPAMHDKYAHSEIADGVSTRLKEIDKYNYIDNLRINGPVSSKFFRLSQDIHKSIIYADSDIKLTDLSVCMTSEYVGRTLRDIPAMAVYDVVGYRKIFTDIGAFSARMFEFVYAFYCMNTNIGILHGDLHLNNATIFKLYTMTPPDGRRRVPDARIVYVVRDDAYSFPHDGFHSMVIDFSRAIIGDYERLEHEFSPRYADMYFAEQQRRMMQIAHHYFPKLVDKYRAPLESLLSSNFPLIFKIFTAIDTYVIMSNILALISLDESFKQVKVTPDALKLLSALIEHSEQLISNNLRAVVEGRISSVADIEWPNFLIIKKHFTNYKLDVNDPSIVVDIFNSNNDVTYDIEDYDTWGPLLTLDSEIELRIKHGLPPHEGIDQWLRHKEHDETATITELTSKYEQNEEDVLLFESWMTM